MLNLSQWSVSTVPLSVGARQAVCTSVAFPKANQQPQPLFHLKSTEVSQFCFVFEFCNKITQNSQV